MKTTQSSTLTAFLGPAPILAALAGCAAPQDDLHQHRRGAVTEKPMAERQVGEGTWIRDRLGRPHYVWPEDPQAPSN